jgi:outer membrane immunogenic protein
MRNLIGMALATAIAGPAMAAEPLASPPPVLAYNWTGIYLGINGGGAWGEQDPFNILTNRFDHDAIGFSGGTVGGTAGAQLQIGHVVTGFETDLNWAGIRGSSNIDPTIFGIPAPFTVNASTSINWDLTARARVGYAFDNVLAYATFGLVLLGAKTDLTGILGLNPCVTVSVINGTPGLLTCNGTDKRLGGTIGAGIEYGLTPSISAKIEYRYTAAASLELSHINEVRAGLNYRFGGP